MDELRDKIAKLEQGLIGPKSQRFNKDDSQLSLEILADLLGRAEVEGADAQALAEELLAKTEQETQVGDEGGAADGDDADDGEDDPKLHRRPLNPTGRRAARKDVIHKVTIERYGDGGRDRRRLLGPSRVLELAPCKWKQSR